MRKKNKEPIPNTDPIRFAQVGLWVTFRILHGKYMGKEYKQYFNLVHPTSKGCQQHGLNGLKKIYQAINFMPAIFMDIYGKRFVMTLESKEQPGNIDYPWATKIVKCRAAKQPEGQTMDGSQGKSIAEDNLREVAGVQTTHPEGNVDNLKNNALAELDLKSDPPAVESDATEKWKAGQEIDEIPF